MYIKLVRKCVFKESSPKKFVLKEEAWESKGRETYKIITKH